MIRPDPEREGVYIVDVSDVFLQRLRDGWSDPVEVMIEDDELVLRDANVSNSLEAIGVVEALRAYLNAGARRDRLESVKVALAEYDSRFPSSRDDEDATS